MQNRSAIVLAGGKSARMGTDKALVKVGKETLIERTCVAVAPLVSELLIITNRPDDFSFLPYRKIPDARPESCPLVGIYTGLLHASNDSCFVLACDLPFLSIDLLRYLSQQGEDADAVVPTTEQGAEPLCALYRKSCLEPIARQLNTGDMKISNFYDKVRTLTVLLNDELPFFNPVLLTNVNTPEELERARALLIRT
ncbi:MAG: molybdenum cofactor guanylyltransferase [Bacteroidetes bacterium]|nr:molybdenum cofactor guanylyltransferase [Bacteroidota bacterium]